MRLRDVYNQLVALAQATAADISQNSSAVSKIGDLTTLTTTVKTTIVAALNELKTGVNNSAVISDSASDTTHTWSASKIAASIAQAKTDIINGAPAAYDTLIEIANQLTADENSIGTLTTAIGNRLRFDAAQSLTSAQQLQARSNIGAMAASLALTGDVTGTATFDGNGNGSVTCTVAGDKVGNKGNMSGSVSCHYTNDGSYIYGTVVGATTLSLTGIPDNTRAYGFTLELTNGGTNVSWPAGITWASGSAPTLKSSGVNLVTLVTRDGGTTFLGISN